jgi:IS30 family transposase
MYGCGIVINNVLIRQYIPKCTNFRKLSIEDMRFIENRLNIRPRKCIDFNQPIVFLKNHCCTSIWDILILESK